MTRPWLYPVYDDDGDLNVTDDLVVGGAVTVAETLGLTGVLSLTSHLDVNDSSTAIRDSSDNELLKFAKTSTAVNELTVTNAATGGAPSLSATGGNTNISLLLAAKAAASVVLRGQGWPVMKMGTITQITTAGAGTYTAAQLLVGFIDRDCTGGSRTDTLDTAANLVAAIPGVAVGDTLYCVVQNNSDMAETITIAAGAGGTDKTIAAGRTIAQNLTRSVLVKFTNVTSGMEAYDLWVGN